MYYIFFIKKNPCETLGRVSQQLDLFHMKVKPDQTARDSR